MEYENNNQVIFLKDIIFAVLYRWKIILVAMLIGALLLGGFQFISNRNVVTESISTADRYKAEQLTQQIKVKDQAIANQIAYMQKSVLMNLDPYNVHQVSVSFYVHTDYQVLPDADIQIPNSTAALLNAYQALTNDSALTKTLADVTGIDVQYVSELISCESNADSNPGVLTVTILHSDNEKVLLMADAVSDYLDSAEAKLSAQLDAHTLSIISVASGKHTSTQLVTAQRQASDQLTALQTDKTKLQTELNKISTSTTLPTNPILLAVIGAFLGAFLVAGIAFVAHLGSAKVYSGRTLVNHTGVKLIARIGKPRCKNPIDRWLKKLEGRPAGDFVEQAAVVAAYLRTRCQAQDNLLLTGDCAEAQIEKMAEALRDAGLHVTACGSILRDARAIEALPQATAVVLVEQCKQSVYRHIEQEISTLKDTNTPLLGCVLLDI